jgi:glycosyltransferase involved in cell wall biosynthesis
MRILFTVHKFPPESLGGTENYAWSLGRILAENGHDVHVFYPIPGLPPDQAYIQRDGMHLWRTPIPAEPGSPVAEFWHSVRNRAVEAAFARLLKRLEPDLVHYQHLQNVSARLIAQAAAIPRVVTLQDYWYFCANGQLIRPDRSICSGPRGGWNCVDCAAHRAEMPWITPLRPLVALPFAARNAYLRTLAEQIDRFIAPSEFLRQEYIRHGFPADRIQTLEYGLDVERVAPGAPPPDEGAPAVVDAPPPADERPHEGLHFGFLGSIVWQKGVHVLVEAFNQLPPGVRLTIHGSEAAYPDYGQEVRALARHPGIRFGGPLHHRQVGAALQQFDCLIIPSVWYENSPLVIQEAYGAGIPVIASRLGAMPEKVREGETGWLFAPGDSDDLARVIRSLLDDPQQVARMKANVHPAPSMQQHAQDMLCIYQELAGQ